ncbi:MAG: hypothetical protein PVG39_06685 [Desulfobacteraceae bacterium]|jgi:hypothetical protein
MSKDLDFSIPETGIKSKKSPIKWVYLLLALLLLICVLNTLILIKGRSVTDKSASSLAPPVEELKQLALKLEKQELSSQAVDAWKEYLSTTAPDADETAKIWYRIGKIYQNKGDFDNALDAFYRSESFSRPDDIKDEISRRIQDCLESAGKFAALRYELGDRVGGSLGENKDSKSITPGSGDKIVAEIGAYKITREELDKKIERLIETRITGLSRYLSPDRINREKENLLKQYSSENGRRAYLEQYIIEEMLYRKAREDRLAETPLVMDSLKEMERSFLASKVLENAYTNEIKVTPTDVKNYYEVNKSKYVKKEEDGKERQFELDEVKDRVTLDLIAEKEKDVQKSLLSQLREKYNVVIHNTALLPSEKKEIK